MLAVNRHTSLSCRQSMPYLSAGHFTMTCMALGLAQAEFGALLGVSKRTSQRYAASGTELAPHTIIDLVRRVYPREPELAASLAAILGGTPESLGAVPPTALPPRAVDSVVLAAADAMNLAPREARLGLHAAFACADELGLTVGAVVEALRSSLPTRAE